ncbi:hypothetical protein CEXT_544571 [Caerostris extrusa]|uniref:Uncharacterized protein n=1 Tax=Caerostris extrusa TaxID=172846 RepID=A0AAV4QFW5_CAEEX|nr:hypothetical protein CEXT_544571 [Caerostris extrusa]
MNLIEWEPTSVAPVRNRHFSSELIRNSRARLEELPPPCRVALVWFRVKLAFDLLFINMCLPNRGSLSEGVFDATVIYCTLVRLRFH